MFIISKFKDYYDGVVGTVGIDKTIVYNRNEEIIEPIDSRFPKEFFGEDYHMRHSIPFINIGRYKIKKINFDEYSPFIVGFCGMIYVGWKYYKIVKDFNNSVSLITTIDYNFNHIKENITGDKKRLSEFVSDMSDILMFDPIEIFRRYNTPIFVYDNDYGYRNTPSSYHYHFNPKFVINANLLDYEFYKKVNAFDAFQEIQMFMSGVLGNKEKEIIQIADKYKIQQHGFDKFSFRKDKESK